MNVAHAFSDDLLEKNDACVAERNLVDEKIATVKSQTEAVVNGQLHEFDVKMEECYHGWRQELASVKQEVGSCKQELEQLRVESSRNVSDCNNSSRVVSGGDGGDHGPSRAEGWGCETAAHGEGVLGPAEGGGPGGGRPAPRLEGQGPGGGQGLLHRGRGGHRHRVVFAIILLAIIVLAILVLCTRA